LTTDVIDRLPPEQHLTRRGFIGGSDAPKVLGVSHFGGPLQVYESKMGLAPPDEGKPWQRWGHILEGPVADEYARRTGHRLVRVKHALIHPRYDFIGGYIDRRIVGTGQKAIYEGKTASAFGKDDWGEPGTDEVPDEYYVQVQHYMAVTGAKWCDLAVLLGGWDFRIYHIDRNEPFIVGMLDAEQTFWHDHIEAAIPPPVGDTEADKRYLSRRYPNEADGTILPATPDDELLIRSLIEAKREAKATEGRVRGAENAIKERIGLNAGLAGAAGMVTWRSQNGRTDWRTVAHEWKNLMGLFIPSEHWEYVTKEGNDIAIKNTGQPFRVLRIKGGDPDAE
jgi:putative phage-type endonuclease